MELHVLFSFKQTHILKDTIRKCLQKDQEVGSLNVVRRIFIANSSEPVRKSVSHGETAEFPSICSSFETTGVRLVVYSCPTEYDFGPLRNMAVG